MTKYRIIKRGDSWLVQFRVLWVIWCDVNWFCGSLDEARKYKAQMEARDARETGSYEVVE